VAVDDSIVQVDRGSLGRVSIEVDVGAISVQGSSDPVVLQHTASAAGDLGKLTGRGEDVPRRSNRGSAEKGANSLVGSIGREGDTGVCTALVIRKSEADIWGCSGLERDSDGSGREKKGGSDGVLHFV